MPCKNCGRQTNPEQHGLAFWHRPIGSPTHSRSATLVEEVVIASMAVVTAGGDVASSAVALPPQAQHASVAAMSSVAKAEKGVSVEGQPMPMPPSDVHQRLMKYWIQEFPVESLQPGWFWQGSVSGTVVTVGAAEQNVATSSQQSWRRKQA